jgi:histidinol-phosphate/aromatic aminotransferase/cobyric acid decarboxylase-like protein
MHPDGLDAAGRVPHGGDDEADVLDFSANVNPDRPPGVAAVYGSALGLARRYPDDGYPRFRAAGAEYLDCSPERVVPTPGGLAAIRLAVGASVRPGDTALVPFPSFGEYAREVRLQGGVPEFVAHDRVVEADPTDHALAVVCNPNNPTGDAYDPAVLQAFARRCRRAGTTLLVDEAFLGFSDRASMADAIVDDGADADAGGDGSDGHGGVVLARSLTKLFGLPGLRAGFAVAGGPLLDRLEAGRQTWNLGTPAAAVGAHCLDESAFVERTRERVRTERARLRAALVDRGFGVSPSSAPFLLLDASPLDAGVDELVARARHDGVAVRDARTFRGLDAHLRVAVRRPGENDRLLAALGAEDGGEGEDGDGDGDETGSGPL